MKRSQGNVAKKKTDNLFKIPENWKAPLAVKVEDEISKFWKDPKGLVRSSRLNNLLPNEGVMNIHWVFHFFISKLKLRPFCFIGQKKIYFPKPTH